MLCCGLVLAALLAPQVLSQEPVFRVDVQLVRVLATVKNAAGQLAGDLQRGDFTIYDNGVPQEIKLFERRTEQPLSVTMLVDISGSTAKDLKYETDSVLRFLQSLLREGNPEDAVALYSFNWRVTLLSSFTRRIERLEHQLKNLQAEAGTSLYDAIYLAAEEMEEREGRRVMVVVTDGGDTVSSKNFHDALEALHDADAIFYAILVTPITNDPGRNVGGENALAGLASSTGGRVFHPAIGSGMNAAFDEILQELRTQYLLGFYPRNVPPSKERFHRIEIKTNRKDLRVISRNGYYGESDAGK